MKTQRLWPPTQGPFPAEPTHDEWQTISLECERLQDQMLRWGRGTGDVPAFNGRLDSLIKVYQADPDSPYQELRADSRGAYDDRCTLLDREIGDAVLSEKGFRHIKKWHAFFMAPAAPGGRPRIARAKGAMTMLRLLLGFGAALELPDCARLNGVMDEMSFPGVPARTVFLTAEMAIAIRRKAHEVGRPSIALAQALQFELMLRQKDVIGEWLRLTEPGLSSIIEGRRKWVGGLDWREIGPDMVLRHRISKTVRGRQAVADPRAGKVETFDLREYPMVMEEFALLGTLAERAGPLIVSEETRLPYLKRGFGKHWRRIARLAGVPDEIQNRDSRAGGVTEATDASEDFEAIRQHAGHSQPSMTARYSRRTVEKKNKVARLRVAHRDGQ
jgi:hypothetical protein